MAWSYNISGGDKDKVRLLIGDTNSNRPLLDDEEIEFFLSQEMNIYMAAAKCCDSLIAQDGIIAAKKVGDLQIKYDHHIFLGIKLRLEARGMGYQVPYMGGISVGDKEAQQSDTDWVEPTISRGLDDNPGAVAPQVNPPNAPTVVE